MNVGKKKPRSWPSRRRRRCTRSLCAHSGAASEREGRFCPLAKPRTHTSAQSVSRSGRCVDTGHDARRRKKENKPRPTGCSTVRKEKNKGVCALGVFSVPPPPAFRSPPCHHISSKVRSMRGRRLLCEKKRKRGAKREGAETDKYFSGRAATRGGCVRAPCGARKMRARRRRAAALSLSLSCSRGVTPAARAVGGLALPPGGARAQKGTKVWWQCRVRERGHSHMAGGREKFGRCVIGPRRRGEWRRRERGAGRRFRRRWRRRRRQWRAWRSRARYICG